MRNSLLILLCILAMPSVSFARRTKASSSWENLNTLDIGERIHIVDTAHRSYNGTLALVTPATITVRLKGGDQSIDRPNVLRVSVRGHWVRHAVIGAAIGAGAGAVIGVAGTNGSCTSGCIGGVTRGSVIGAATGVGAVIGAIIGALVHSHRTVYHSPLY
ncbi:MAG TPA: hypothetical protein VMH00_04055 [Candidatus Limnocylindrales bacterium]|nr:hypothetical protein [Candidatus Limnocylindrales bacterium]